MSAKVYPDDHLSDQEAEIARLKDEAAWWREATEIKKQQLKQARDLARRRGRELLEVRAELKRLRDEMAARKWPKGGVP